MWLDFELHHISAVSEQQKERSANEERFYTSLFFSVSTQQRQKLTRIHCV
jgi:hypothetical protein